MSQEAKKWDDFIALNDGSFLQSWAWGNFQKTFGRKIWRLQNKEETWKVQAFGYPLPFGLLYLYVPRGPIIAGQRKKQGIEDFRSALLDIKKLAERIGAIFVKIEPESLNTDFLDILNQEGFVASLRQIQPAETIVLDLARSEKELQLKFKPKTRYNIRVAVRHRVRVRQSQGLADFEEFWRILKGTSQRQGFRTHPKIYYQKMITSGVAQLFLAEHGKERLSDHLQETRHHTFKSTDVVAVILINFFGGRATYLHGASSHDHRRLMAPYFLHWKLIKEAKSRGCRLYDFWGVSDRWPGVSRFKEGWGGFRLSSSGAWDLVLKPSWHKVYKFASNIRRGI